MRTQDEIRREMKEVAEKIDFLEDSKFMQNRLEVSNLLKRWRNLQNELFQSKKISNGN